MLNAKFQINDIIRIMNVKKATKIVIVPVGADWYDGLGSKSGDYSTYMREPGSGRLFLNRIFQMGQLFFIAAFSMLVAAAMGLIETFEVRRFNRMYFDIGLKVFRRELELKAVDQQNMPTEIIYKKEGKFKYISVGECLFVSNAQLLDFSRFQAPLPFKGSAIWRKDRVSITGRLPPGRVVLLVLFAILWTGFSLRDDLIEYLIVLLVIISVVIAGYVIEKKRIEKMVLELEEIVAESRENVSKE